jgi:hypothetical protein
MFPPDNLNNPPTASKSEGRSDILLFKVSAVFAVGYLNLLQNAETRENNITH